RRLPISKEMRAERRVVKAAARRKGMANHEASELVHRRGTIAASFRQRLDEVAKKRRRAQQEEQGQLTDIAEDTRRRIGALDRRRQELMRRQAEEVDTARNAIGRAIADLNS